MHGGWTGDLVAFAFIFSLFFFLSSFLISFLFSFPSLFFLQIFLFLFHFSLFFLFFSFSFLSFFSLSSPVLSSRFSPSLSIFHFMISRPNEEGTPFKDHFLLHKLGGPSNYTGVSQAAGGASFVWRGYMTGVSCQYVPFCSGYCSGNQMFSDWAQGC
jgi:hypothetical protein